MSTDYPRLADEAWLREKYHDEGKTLAQVADIVGCNDETVRRWMQKQDIERRSASEANQLENEPGEKFFEIIEGEMLGDGCLVKPSEASSGSIFTYTTSRSKYRDWLASLFENIGFDVAYYDHEIENTNGTTSQNHKFETKTYRYLLPARERWYEIDTGGEKSIPVDVAITPLSLRQWYIGDGSITQRDGGRQIELWTVGFSDAGEDILPERLTEVGIEANNGGRGIQIRSDSNRRFFEYMASLPPQLEGVYGYKW